MSCGWRAIACTADDTPLPDELKARLDGAKAASAPLISSHPIDQGGATTKKMADILTPD